jgi:hypothetical protein
MNSFKIILSVLAILSFSDQFAQNTKLSSYTFGEGYNFTNANGSTFQDTRVHPTIYGYRDL